MSYKVMIPSYIVEEGVNLLKDAGLEVVTLFDEPKEKVLEQLSDYDAILTRLTKITLYSDTLEGKTDGLKVVGVHGAGVDNIDVDKATELGIAVISTPEANAEAVAEHTIGLIIALTKHIVKTDKVTRAGGYEDRDQFVGVNLEGKKLGIVGPGGIGSRVGTKMAKAFDMEVLTYHPGEPSHTVPSEMTLTNNWEGFIKECDVISLHCPLIPQTEGMVGKEEFRMMKDDAYLINVARGPIIDEKALIEALDQGELAGAALDVYEEEPPADDNPLFEMDNVVVTPHTAWLTKETRIKMAVDSAQGIIDVLNGDQPEYIVNPEVFEG
ncbi:hydroxyacid dehydrogenase [Candidatus Bipolaricaulota bacterium]|nr:hydroxyacid dehydrogenase [Candidatus Bipolaricaulota bacterium]